MVTPSWLATIFVANAGGDLAQLSHLKIKEGNSMEEFNPWNRNVKMLERVLDSHDLIMKEGKEGREATKIVASQEGVTIGVNIASK